MENFKNPLKAFAIEAKNDLPINTSKKIEPELLIWKNKLAEAKLPLDKYWSNNFAKYWREFDPFKSEKDIIVDMSNTFNISNAWLKCYEMLCYFHLVPHEAKKFYHFDNAAFPGSFIISTHHYVKTRTKIDDYKWYASSLAEKNALASEPLEDKYKLFTNYRKNWLMTEKNNGDVLVEANQKDFADKIGNTIDLYTSDLGFDVSSDYNNQEMLQAAANIGQILSGLLTLKDKGSLITKQYTFFEPISLSVIYATASFFEEFYIVKPYTSREANSEIYLVGKGFKTSCFSDSRFKHPYIRAMFDRATGKVPIETPFINYDKTFLSSIISATSDITQSQIDKLKHDIAECNAIVGNYRGQPSRHERVLAFREQIKSTIYSWYYYNPIIPIDTKDRLRMKDALGQNKN